MELFAFMKKLSVTTVLSTCLSFAYEEAKLLFFFLISGILTSVY